jgi:integrase
MQSIYAAYAALESWLGKRPQAAEVSCHFHDLRHTFISRLAESQASDSTVMALAGHIPNHDGKIQPHTHGSETQGG